MKIINLKKQPSFNLLKLIPFLPLPLFAVEQAYPLKEDINNPGLPAFLNVLRDNQARAFIESDGETPRVIGFRFPASMLADLPEYPGRGTDFVDRGRDEQQGYSDRILCSPSGKCAGGYRSFYDLESNDQQPFELIQFAWNPGGYADPRDRIFYATALMGVHFYITDMEEIDQIAAGDYTLGIDRPVPFNTGLTEEAYNRVSKAVPPEMLPNGNFRNNVFAVPRMGAHHPDSRVLSNDRFTGMTMVYGSNDGRIIFLEPIIFRSLIDDILVCNNFPYMDFGQQAPFNITTNVEMPMIRNTTAAPSTNKCDEISTRVCQSNPLPSEFIKGGLYPRTYCLTYDTSSLSFEITLENLVRVAGPSEPTSATTEKNSSSNNAYSFLTFAVTAALTAYYNSH